MSEVAALHKEVQRAITEMNDRLLKVEGETFALRNGVALLARCLADAGIIDRDGWNDYTKSCASQTLEQIEEQTSPTKTMLSAASAAFLSFSIEGAAPKGFAPVVIEGGKNPD